MQDTQLTCRVRTPARPVQHSSKWEEARAGAHPLLRWQSTDNRTCLRKDANHDFLLLA